MGLEIAKAGRRLVKEAKAKRSGKVRVVVLERDSYTCLECKKSFFGKESDNLHCHHVVPIFKGGLDNESNCVLLCKSCHKDVHYAIDKHDWEKVDIIIKQFLKQLDKSRKVWIVRSRSRLPYVHQTNEGWMVEGSMDGDDYDEYLINIDKLECECYYHGWGGVRAERVCTHVGSVILEQMYQEVNRNWAAMLKAKDVELEQISEIRREAKDLAEVIAWRGSKTKFKQAASLVSLVESTGVPSSWYVNQNRVRLVGNKYHCTCGEKFPCIHRCAVMLYRRMNR